MEASPYTSNSGEVASFLAFFEPQSLTHQERERLHVLEKVFEVAKDVIIISSANNIDQASEGSKILDVNPAFTAITGYQKEDIIGQSSDLLRGPDTKQKKNNRQDIKNCNGKEELLLNYRVDGSHFWTYQTINPILDENGKPTHWVSIQKEVSSQINYQENLNKLANLFLETQMITKTGTWELDINSGKTIWTEEVYRIHEVSPDFDHNKENGIEFYHPDDRPILIQSLEEAISNKNPFDITCRLHTAKGRKLIVRVTGKPFIEKGKVCRLVGVIQDISDQHRIEEGLKVLNDRLQLAAKAANMGVWDYFPIENELHWDEKMYELYGTEKEKFSGAYDAWASSLLPESLEKAQKELELALMGIKDFKTEFEIILPNGSKRTIAGEAIVKRNANGEAVRMIGVNYDITSKIEDLKELNMFRSIVESVGDSIIITSADPYNPVILYSNPAHEKMTGYCSKEVIGKSPKLFQGPESHREALNQIREALIAEQDFQIELKNYRKNGETFWINMYNTFVRNEASETTHFISIQRDVTKRKLEELEILQAKEDAEKASKSKSEFLSVMSHEIRTPLNAVIGVSGLLDGTNLDKEQRDLVNTIRQGGENLLSVINDILDFSKIESGRIELEQVEFEVQNPIEDVIDLLSTQAFEKGLEIMAEIDDNVVGLYLGDIGRIRQVLMNLIGNAIKFTDRGEVIISLFLAQEFEDYCEFEFRVKDTGIGIPEDKLGRLFRSFSQVDASTTRKYGGSGLGLAIAKKLVNVMGGEIWVNSVEGKGTTFFFTLKLLKAKSKPTKIYPYKDLKGKKVLIIDDNQTSLSILESQLTEKEILVNRYDKPKDLMRFLNRGNLPDWDLAILDYYMPEMNGYELAN
ncbi:MAG: PAS domain-containing protein, partial [Bacteroidota bacterium]